MTGLCHEHDHVTNVRKHPAELLTLALRPLVLCAAVVAVRGQAMNALHPILLPMELLQKRLEMAPGLASTLLTILRVQLERWRAADGTIQRAQRAL